MGGITSAKIYSFNLGVGFSELIVKLFAETVVSEKSFFHQHTSVPFFQLPLFLV